VWRNGNTCGVKFVDQSGTLAQRANENRGPSTVMRRRNTSHESR